MRNQTSIKMRTIFGSIPLSHADGLPCCRRKSVAFSFAAVPNTSHSFTSNAAAIAIRCLWRGWLRAVSQLQTVGRLTPTLLAKAATVRPLLRRSCLSRAGNDEFCNKKRADEPS